MARRLHVSRFAWLFLPVLAVLGLVGCPPRPFAITGRKICTSVDGTGKAGPETTKFTTQDKSAHVWLSYVRAKPGQAIKVKCTYTDQGGVKATREARTELNSGDGSCGLELMPPSGETLAPGKYEAQITNDADVALGPALAFEVVASGAPAGGPAPPAPEAAVGQPNP